MEDRWVASTIVGGGSVIAAAAIIVAVKGAIGIAGGSCMSNPQRCAESVARAYENVADDLGQMTPEEVEWLRQQSNNTEFVVTGSRSETDMGLVNRALAQDMLKAGFPQDEIEAATGVPKWRVGVPTGKPEFDYFARGGLPPEVQGAIYERWGQGVDRTEFFDNWTRFSDYADRDPGGLVFSRGEFLGRNRYEPWQRWRPE